MMLDEEAGALWRAVAELALELHPDWIERLARVLEQAQASAPLDLSTVLPKGVPLEPLVQAWERYPVNGELLAAALRASAATARIGRERERVELVWTGPSTGLVATRHTEQVSLEVIQSARREVFLVSFVAYEVPSIIEALNEATRRHVTVSVLLESASEQGGALTVDSVRKMKLALPTAEVYVWDRQSKLLDTGGLGGSVHAKCVVADAHTCFVTSANLTVAALERNMEIGVLVRGGPLPAELAGLLRGLIVQRKLVRV